MDVVKSTEMSHALYRARGDAAELVAAQRERELKEAGEDAVAAQWRTIRSQVRRLRGANQS